MSPDPKGTPAMLTVVSAWRVLCRRTGGRISRTTFYRCINSGKVNAIRLDFRFMIPLAEMERIIKLCLDGERL